MKVINFGSINIDHVYSVEHFVRPGETLRSEGYQVFSGGKGANQSIALAYAGAKVFHAGKIGHDSEWLREGLRRCGVDTSMIDSVDIPTGHAIIQVNAQGENAIIIHAGANESFGEEEIKRVLDVCESGDYLLLQNEINGVDRILNQAKNRGIHIVFNPAPMSEAVKTYPLDEVEVFIINEVEGEMLTAEHEPKMIIKRMQELYPQSQVLLTLGKDGLVYAYGKKHITKAALEVQTVDTTGAGDTFIGYFLAGLMKEEDIEMCLDMAIKASALCVTRKGAADSIPTREELFRVNVI